MIQRPGNTETFAQVAPSIVWEYMAELDQLVNMDQIPNTELFGFWKFYEYQIPNYSVFENERIPNIE